MLVGHQWMLVSAEHKKIVDWGINGKRLWRIGGGYSRGNWSISGSYERNNGKSSVDISGGLGNNGPPNWRVVSIIKRNLVNIIVIVVVVDYKQSFLSEKSVERFQKLQWDKKIKFARHGEFGSVVPHS